MNRFRDIAEAMGIDTAHMTTTEAADACIDAIRLISRQIGIPNNLRVLGVKPEDFEIMQKTPRKTSAASPTHAKQPKNRSSRSTAAHTSAKKNHRSATTTFKQE